jgi:hypothetical protein
VFLAEFAEGAAHRGGGCVQFRVEAAVVEPAGRVFDVVGDALVRVDVVVEAAYSYS